METTDAMSKIHPEVVEMMDAAWGSSKKDATARAYMAGMIDALNYGGFLTGEAKAEAYIKFVGPDALETRSF